MDYTGYDSDNAEDYPDYEWNTELNEDVFPEIDKDFRNNILNVKHNLYKDIVFSGKEGSEETQDNNLINKYLNSVNKVYVLSLNMQKSGSTNEIDLSEFPPNSQQAIMTTLSWIKKYFSENTIPDTIPYKDYIQKSFHEYPYVQTDTFLEEESPMDN